MTNLPTNCSTKIDDYESSLANGSPLSSKG